MNYVKIIVVIPTYNEIDSIGILIDELFEANPYLSVLIIDDNSPDATYEEVRHKQVIYKNLHLIVRDKKRGLGSAYIEGFKYALENEYETILQMDADLSHSPFYIPEMLNSLNDYDLIIGSRYIKKGELVSWPWVRVLLSRLANIFAKTLLCIPINDVTSGFKCMKKSVLEQIDFASLPPRGYVFQIEITFRAFLKGFRLKECPIRFIGRKNDKSKMSFWIAREAFFRVIFLCFKRLFMK